MPTTGGTTRGLTVAQIEHFIRDGFIQIAGAFPRTVADTGRAILWRDTGCDPTDPTTWTQPVIRLGLYGEAPFATAANTPILHHAFDQLVGRGRWLPRLNLGTFPIRFPSPHDPGDTGWHIDVSFATEATDPAGAGGLSLRELAATNFVETAHRPEVWATGEAGTTYLCHPFLMHAAQPHRGMRPRFLAQPPLLPAEPCVLEREGGRYSPVEQAIRNALRNVDLMQASQEQATRKGRDARVVINKGLHNQEP